MDFIHTTKLSICKYLFAGHPSASEGSHLKYHSVTSSDSLLARQCVFLYISAPEHNEQVLRVWQLPFYQLQQVSYFWLAYITAALRGLFIVDFYIMCPVCLGKGHRGRMKSWRPSCITSTWLPMTVSHCVISIISYQSCFVAVVDSWCLSQTLNQKDWWPLSADA